MIVRALLLFLIILICSFRLSATIKLPAIFCDNMVLQQQSKVAIWGTANKNVKVKIITSWDNHTYLFKSDENGRWRATLSTIAAGGPYSIRISDGESVELKNVLLGEVWICSGQSNMEIPMEGYTDDPVLNSNEFIAKSKNRNIRLFNVSKAMSVEPLDTLVGSWKECSPKSVVSFSATAYFFGRMLNEVLDVPIGLISSCWGGSAIETWIGKEEFKAFPECKLPVNGERLNPFKTPSILYNGMIRPLVGYGIKGCIWYQGESNKNNPNLYRKLLPAMVSQWRRIWGIGDFDFYYTQIAPYDYGKGLNSAFMREVLLNLEQEIPNSKMAVLMDVGEKDFIHPSNKEVTGNRLAYIALAKSYNVKGIAFAGPVFKSMKISNDTVTVEFDSGANGLTSYGKELRLFELAGKDRQFFPAKAVILKYHSSVQLICDEVKEPVAVRYAFKDFVVGDLYNTRGIPASSFRTDDWEYK